MAPPDDIVEISADIEMPVFPVKTSENRIEMDLQMVILYVVERPGLLPGHPL